MSLSARKPTYVLAHNLLLLCLAFPATVAHSLKTELAGTHKPAQAVHLPAPSPKKVIKAAKPEPEPEPAHILHEGYTAIYQASYKGLPLRATHRLERSEGAWHFSSIASGFFGQIEENATFTYSATGIIPQNYNYLRSVLGKNRENSLIFNHTDHIAVSTAGDKTRKIPLHGGELDPGTYMLALRDDLMRGKQAVCYQVVEERDTDQYCFRIAGQTTLDTALGKLPTVVIARIRKPSSPRHTRYWMAPSLGYSIVKLEHQEVKGETAYSLDITHFKRDADKPIPNQNK